jgi:hypothetical protein
MWNSPHRKSKKGKRYSIEDIGALTCTLDQTLDFLKSMPVSEVVREPILQRMDKEELIFAIYQVLEALLDDVPVPPKGHTGFQEAVIAELLYQTYALICCELDDVDYGDSARKAAWKSIERLVMERDVKGKRSLWQLDDLRLNLGNPRAYRSKKITTELWEDLLLGEAGLWNEFLWDDDWRMDQLLDLPEEASKPLTALAGIDLDTVHELPHAPSKAESNMSEYYVRYVIWKDEASNQ